MNKTVRSPARYYERWDDNLATSVESWNPGGLFYQLKVLLITIVFYYATAVRYHYHFVQHMYDTLVSLYGIKIESAVLRSIVSLIYTLFAPHVWVLFEIRQRFKTDEDPSFMWKLQFLTSWFYCKSKDKLSMMKTKTFWRRLLSKIDGIDVPVLVAESFTEENVSHIELHKSQFGELIFKIDNGCLGEGSGVFCCNQKEELRDIMRKQQQKRPGKYLILKMENFYKDKKCVFHIQTLCDKHLKATVVSIFGVYGFQNTSHEVSSKDDHPKVFWIEPLTWRPIFPNGNEDISEMLVCINEIINELKTAVSKSLEAHRNLRSMNDITHCYIGWDVMVNDRKKIIFFEGNPSPPRMFWDTILYGWFAALRAYKRLGECFSV